MYPNLFKLHYPNVTSPYLTSPHLTYPNLYKLHYPNVNSPDLASPNQPNLN
jgi:hypothetical protein